MEQVESVVSLISQVGFPIVMVGVMCFYIKYLTDQTKDQIRELQDKFISAIQKVEEDQKEEIKEIKDLLKGE